MSGFDMNEYEGVHSGYEAEAESRWGKTDAYKESRERTRNYSKEKFNDAACQMKGIFSEFAACKSGGCLPDSEEAQALVTKLRDCITANFYNCTDEILCGLGQMYVCDDRFMSNIDNAGEGTAVFVSKAIEIYCKMYCKK